MLHPLKHSLSLLCLGTVACFVVSCGSTGGHGGAWQAKLGPVPVNRKIPPVAMLQEVNLKQDMIEHNGNDLALTIDKTARLTAFLMYEHNVPLSHVVPHYHWPRRGVTPPNKDCPHFLLDNGRPGATWQWFLDRVQAHYSRLVP